MKTIIEKSDRHLRFQALSPAGVPASWGSGSVKDMHLNGSLVKALAIGGVGSRPEFRRTGLVRGLFEAADAFAQEQDCLFTILHPFSFEYYRKFGFERVADHRILEFPMSALNFAPFFRDMTPCEDASSSPALSRVYNAFAAGRNIMFRRSEDYDYTCGGSRQVYLYSDASGAPAAYLSFDAETYYDINRMAGVRLNVHELAFLSPDGLMKLFGFMRMFEGELENVKIHNCAMCPEVEQLLRHYTHTSIRILPDLMARVNNVPKALEAFVYPSAPGSFTLRVFEPEKTSHPLAVTDGVFRVDYEGGRARVQALDPDAPFDLSCSVPSLTRLLFGYESFGADFARYLRDTKIPGDASDFFRAFPNRPCGLFEHF